MGKHPSAASKFVYSPFLKAYTADASRRPKVFLWIPIYPLESMKSADPANRLILPTG
jgi:hypothetical protein